jgi:hypothetical protein
VKVWWLFLLDAVCRVLRSIQFHVALPIAAELVKGQPINRYQHDQPPELLAPPFSAPEYLKEGKRKTKKRTALNNGSHINDRDELRRRIR